MAIGTLTRQARGLIPADRIKRRYVLICLVNSAGSGLFLSGTAVFAMRVLRLSPQQIGFGFSAAGLAALLASAAVGSFVDRFGAKRALLAAGVLEGFVAVGYCVLRSFPAFTLLTCLSMALMSCIVTAMAAYGGLIAAGPERIRLVAQTRSLGNASFGAGAGLAALVLAAGTTPVLYLLPAGDAASFFAVAALAISLPEGRVAAGKLPPGRAAAEKPPEGRAAAGKTPNRPLPVRRNPPFLIAMGLNAVLRMHDSLILIVVPLWIVTRTSAPRPLLGLLLVMNTAGCVLFQVRASAGTETLAGSVRKVRMSAVVMLPACALLALSGHVPTALAILLVTAGYAAVTGTELLQSAGEWGIMCALAPPDAQGDYAGAFGMSAAVQRIVGPGIGGWLVLRYGTGGWLILGVMVLLAASLIGPTVRWTARMAERRHTGITANLTLARLGAGERD